MHVGVRDATLYQAGYPDAVSGLRDLQIHHLELAIDARGRVRSLVDDEILDLSEGHGLAVLRKQAVLHGIHLTTLLCSQDFNAPDPTPQVEWVVRAVHVAQDLGIPAVRVDSAMTGQVELPLEERVSRFCHGLAAVLEATPESRVFLAIENHGPQGNDPDWMRAVLRTAASPRVGVTFDLGNWYWWGHPLSRIYEIADEFAPRVRATHVKNIHYPQERRETPRPIGWEYGTYVSPLDEGDVDLARLAAILAAAGYRGALTIEDESLGKYPAEQRAAILHRDVAHLREILQRLGVLD